MINGKSRRKMGKLMVLKINHYEKEQHMEYNYVYLNQK